MCGTGDFVFLKQQGAPVFGAVKTRAQSTGTVWMLLIMMTENWKWTLISTLLPGKYICRCMTAICIFLYGKVPQGFDQQPELEDGVTRTIKEGNDLWYVYDLSFRLAPDYTVYVRGITSVTEAETSFTITLRFAMILLPLMVLATAMIGYRFTRRTLLPVRQITSTVREIRADADLSRRIGLTGQSGEEDKNRTKSDEIYTLAATFDDMLGELEKVFDREKRFTSDVSHELRTPVGVILAQCGAMMRDPSLSEENQAGIRLIERKAKGMADMISQLLFLSRADQGRQLLNKRSDRSERTHGNDGGGRADACGLPGAGDPDRGGNPTGNRGLGGRDILYQDACQSDL